MPKHIAVNTNKSIKILKVTDIVYLESSGRNTIIYLQNKEKIIVCKNLGVYEKIFSKLTFLRVHNSFILNFEFVSNIIRDAGGQYCLMNNNNMVPISNRKFIYVKEYLHY